MFNLLSLLAGCALLLRTLQENGRERHGAWLGVPGSSSEVGAGCNMLLLNSWFDFIKPSYPKYTFVVRYHAEALTLHSAEDATFSSNNS